MVICKLRISAHLKRRSTPRQKLAKLNHDYLSSQAAKTLFCKSILNKLPINQETNCKYDELAHAMEKAAHETLPKGNRPPPGWFKKSEVSLKSLTEKRNSALLLKISRPTRSSSQRLHKIRNELPLTQQIIYGSLLLATNLMEVLSHERYVWDSNVGIPSEY